MAATERSDREIKRRLLERFRSFKPGARLPSERELTREMGVAYLTVNRAMQELAWEGYLRRIPRRGTFLASHERVVTSDPATGRAGGESVLFAYPNYFSYAAWRRLREAETQALRLGLGVVEFKMNPDTTCQRLAAVVSERADLRGVFVLPVPDSIRRQEFEVLDGLGCPVVLLAVNDRVAYGRNVWAITNDWQRAGYLKANALLARGHRELAYLHHEPDSTEQKRMLKGMRQAMADAGLSPRELRVLGGDTQPWKSTREAGYRLALKLFRSRSRGRSATGLIFDSLGGVEGMTRAAKECGVRVPEDVSVIVTGNESERAEFFAPPLTTVSSDPAEEIRIGLDCILHPEQATTRTYLVAPRLVERTSIVAVGTVSLPQRAQSARRK